MKKSTIGALLSAAVLAVSSASAQLPQEQPSSWHNEVVVSDRGHIWGKPEADTRLIEFISYSCGVCASFAKEGDPALEYAFVSPGHVAVEIRPVIRNALDLTVSMLVACGGPEKFKGNHAMFLRSQSDWLDIAINAPQTQVAIWNRGDRNARVNLAAALDFDDMMATRRGYTASEVSTCLADDAMAQQLLANDDADRAAFAIQGTPSFALDGNLLEGVHSWGTLYPILSDTVRGRLAPPEQGFTNQ